MSDSIHGLTHFDEGGNAVMVDVTEKRITDRVATAVGRILVGQQTYDAIRGGTAQKGDVLGVARVAGEVRCTVRVAGQTGVEMEALTGATVALLTVYDMCKAIDKGMEIQSVYLLRKSGGKSGDFVNPKHKEEAP